jgi:pilus assembly protein Flp/PilA
MRQSRYGFADMRSPRVKPVKSAQRGVTSIEYALIGALIAVAIVGAASTLGQSVDALYASVAEKVACAAAQNCP